MTSKPGVSGVSVSGMSGGAASTTTTQEFTVRVPCVTERKKKLSLMKFPSGPGVDFAKLGNVSAKMERENNLKEFKTANDLDMMPKFGAGSEYGRDQKEEARRKKYGIVLKKYSPEEQPWHLKVGSGKQAKKFRGVREGTVSENTSYYIFTQCPDGAFEAFPVQEWYSFSPMIRYKFLNADEAEDEFTRRDKTLNFFNIMLKKRVKNDDKDNDLDEDEKVAKTKVSKSKKKKKDFLLTDMDDWAEISEDDEDADEGDDEDEEKSKDDGEKGKNAKKAQAAARRKKVKNSKQNSDDEAIEESDEGDYDDREVDYMSDSSSGQSEPEEKDKKYEEKGVAEEAGLRNILNSDDEEEEEEENKEEEEEEEKRDEEKPPKEKKTGSDISSSSSDSDSDIDKDEKITSALLMQKDRTEKKKPGDKGDKPSGSSEQTESKSLKRKADGDAPSAKKSKREHSSPSYSSSIDGITEDTIRRYLQRKPMTTKDLLQKFRSKKLNLTNEQMSNTIAQLLKRINPERTTINKKLYLSLKKPE